MSTMHRFVPYLSSMIAFLSLTAFAIEPGEAIDRGSTTLWTALGKLALAGIGLWGAKVLYFYVTGDESDRKKMRGELRAFGMVLIVAVIIDAAAGPYLKLIFKFFNGDYLASKIK